MANYIETTLNNIDAAVNGYAAAVFTGIAGPLVTTLQAMGLVGLGFLAINAMMQFQPIRISEYIKWGLRFVVIFAVATSWNQFQPIFDILTNTPGSVGASMLGMQAVPNLNAALDQMVTDVLLVGEQTSASAGAFDFGTAIIGVGLIFMGALMATVAILVSAIAKIGLALAVSVAPVFVGTLLFKGTSDLFSAWSRFTLGFALIPLVLAGVMGAVLGVGGNLAPANAGNVTSLSDVAAFIIIVLAAIIMMSQVPTMVNGLAGSIVATASTRDMQQAGRSMTVAAGGMTAAASRMAQVAAPAVSSAAASANEGRRQEGPMATRLQTMMSNWEAHKQAGRANRERYAKRSALMGETASWSDLRQADRAGRRQAARETWKGTGEPKKDS